MKKFRDWTDSSRFLLISLLIILFPLTLGGFLVYAAYLFIEEILDDC